MLWRATAFETPSNSTGLTTGATSGSNLHISEVHRACFPKRMGNCCVKLMDQPKSDHPESDLSESDLPDVSGVSDWLEWSNLMSQLDQNIRVGEVRELTEYHIESDQSELDQSETRTTCEVCEYHTTKAGVSCGTINQDSGPSCTEIEEEIEASKVHWSELSFNCCYLSHRESNKKTFERLRLLPKYRDWLSIDKDVNSFHDLVLERKLAEGAQAEIIEVEDRRKKQPHLRYVLKVFKKGYSLQEQQMQWPEGILSEKYFNPVLKGGMVLEDDRFAFLLLRCEIDLRKLIDVAQEDNSPLMEDNRKPLEEFRTYVPQTRRRGCSTPIFINRCAQQIMLHIAYDMLWLHNNDVLHRDLKASNILCYSYKGPDYGSLGLLYAFGVEIPPGQRRRVLVYVADYESSVGVVGTGFWRAPEILQQLKERKAKVHFTREADVYSYAMICYEILTGHKPFEGYKTNDYDNVLNGVRPTLPNHVPTWLRKLIHRCWHQNPSERPTFSAIMDEFKSHRSFIPRLEPVNLEGQKIRAVTSTACLQATYKIRHST